MIKRDIRLTTYSISNTPKPNALVLSKDTGEIDSNYIPVLSISKIILNITTVSSNTTLGSNHYIVLVNASGGGVTITLPSASANVGKSFIIKKIDSSNNSVTISPQSGQTVDGQSSIQIETQYQLFGIVSNGSNWFIIFR